MEGLTGEGLFELCGPVGLTGSDLIHAPVRPGALGHLDLVSGHLVRAQGMLLCAHISITRARSPSSRHPLQERAGGVHVPPPS